MAWKIEFAPEAAKELRKLDSQMVKRINSFLQNRIALATDPRTYGEALKGSRFHDLWKYRVGDYRLICSIEDAVVTVLVARIGHRRDVYR